MTVYDHSIVNFNKVYNFNEDTPLSSISTEIELEPDKNILPPAKNFNLVSIYGQYEKAYNRIINNLNYVPISSDNKLNYCNWLNGVLLLFNKHFNIKFIYSDDIIYLKDTINTLCIKIFKRALSQDEKVLHFVNNYFQLGEYKKKKISLINKTWFTPELDIAQSWFDNKNICLHIVSFLNLIEMINIRKVCKSILISTAFPFLIGGINLVNYANKTDDNFQNRLMYIIKYQWGIRNFVSYLKSGNDFSFLHNEKNYVRNIIIKYSLDERVNTIVDNCSKIKLYNVNEFTVSINVEETDYIKIKNAYNGIIDLYYKNISKNNKKLIELIISNSYNTKINIHSNNIIINKLSVDLSNVHDCEILMSLLKRIIHIHNDIVNIFFFK